MDLVWITPNKKCKNISITIEKIYLGMTKNNRNNYYYTIDTPILSESIYKELIQYLNIANNKTINTNTFQYLKFNKQTEILKKVDKKNLLRFSRTICPLCQHSNCLECTKTKFRNYMKRYTIFGNKQ